MKYQFKQTDSSDDADIPDDTLDRVCLYTRFTSLYEHYRPAVLNLATLLLGDTDEAQDVVQTVFTTLWEQHDRIDRIDSMDAYLYRMTKNTVFNRLKHQAIVQRYESTASSVESAEDPVSTADMLSFIERAISEMPEQRRRIFRMSRFEEQSYADISDALHISQRTVQSHISAALAQLRKAIHDLNLIW